jgi:nitroreductase
MELLTAIRERRSVRKYKSKPVPEEILAEILDAARLSPSWANTQTWRFVVVRDQDVKKKLQETMRPVNPCREAFLEAPIVICVVSQRGLAGCRQGEPVTNKGDNWFMFDAGIVMEHLVLSAWDQGLGTCHVGAFDAAKAEEILGVPGGYSIVSMTPLGYFDTPPEARPRKPMAEIVYLNGFGEPYIK